MKRGMGWKVVALVAGMGASGGLAPASGQVLDVVVGAASYDLSGTGTSWVGGIRYGYPLATRLHLEAGASVFGYESQSDDTRVFLLPELGVGTHFPLGRATLRVGVGGGMSVTVRGEEDSEPTLFAALAVDLPAAGAVRLSPGVRYRAVDPWAGTIFEYTLGVRIGLGG